MRIDTCRQAVDNKKGELVLPCVYNLIGYISDGIAVVLKIGDDISGSKRGYANANGLITSEFYDYAAPFAYGMGNVVQNGKNGFVNSEGKEIIPCIYDDARSFADGLAPVKKDYLKYGNLIRHYHYTI